jgi:hypothetical protein
MSRGLQITLLQWVYPNFSLHDEQKGYLRRKYMKGVMIKIETLLGTRPNEIPKESQFLLDFDHGKLTRSNIHNKTYCVLSTEVSIIVG